MQYKPRVDHGAGNGESNMSKFQVGDVIENFGDLDPINQITFGERFTVTDCKGGGVYFTDSNGIVRARPEGDYKLIHRPEQTPPATITHEGYTYNRGERVVPEWVKDGTWVVCFINNELAKISIKGDEIFLELKGGEKGRIPNEDLIASFRPHTPEDYKWGDWAMYEGKKVFVMTSPDGHGLIAVSGIGLNTILSNWNFVRQHELTPTFAP